MIVPFQAQVHFLRCLLGEAGQDDWGARRQAGCFGDQLRCRAADAAYKAAEAGPRMRNVARDLCDAEPAEVSRAYQKLGLRLTYHPGRNLVQATAGPRPANLGKWLVSEGRAEPFAYAGRLSAEFRVGTS